MVEYTTGFLCAIECKDPYQEGQHYGKKYYGNTRAALTGWVYRNESHLEPAELNFEQLRVPRGGVSSNKSNNI